MSKRTIFQRAFLRTIPVLMGYLVLGMAFGLLMHQAGISSLWSFLMSIFVFAGSLQFVMVGLLSQQVSLLTIALSALAVNSRHIFYGISFIERFKKNKRTRPYMIFSLTDETYALLCSLPEGEHSSQEMFYVALLDQLYWICGTLLGAVAGTLIPFDFTGVEFAMSALFMVIVVDQWREVRNRQAAIIGLIVAILALLLLGPERFLLPSLSICAFMLLLLSHKRNQKSSQRVSL